MTEQLTLVTGPAGCSKSTVVELIRDHLAEDSRKFIAIDTSVCLENSRKYNTPAGIQLKAMKSDQDRGLILPGEPVVRSVRENLGWIRRETVIHHGAIAGSPRSVEEAKIWLAARQRGEVDFRVVLIECTLAQVKQGIYNRIQKGIVREDQGPKEVETRWAEYNRKVVPAVRCLPKELVAYTSRSKPLLERIHDVVNHMILPDNIRKRWLRRLGERSHPIHAAIREIEQVKAAKEEAASRADFDVNPRTESAETLLPASRETTAVFA